jgi:hypothetical protein
MIVFVVNKSDANGGLFVVRMKFFEATEGESEFVKKEELIKDEFQNFADGIIFIGENNIERVAYGGFRFVYNKGVILYVCNKFIKFVNNNRT